MLDPFAAVREMRRVLKPGSHVFITTPFNLRIHGPLPDCWRFTEHGLRVLLKDLTIVSLEQTDCVGRMLMPTHYRVIALKEDPGALSKGPRSSWSHYPTPSPFRLRQDRLESLRSYIRQGPLHQRCEQKGPGWIPELARANCRAVIEYTFDPPAP